MEKKRAILPGTWGLVMYFKKTSHALCPLLGLMVGFVLCFAVTPRLQADVILVDRIAAVVNEEIITLTDIDKAIQLYPGFRTKDQTEQQFYNGVLRDLIHYKTIHMEYKDEVEPTEEDFLKVETSIIKKVGSYNKLISILTRFDMQWDDFRAFIREKVVYDKVMRDKLQEKISINFQEIRTFYKEQYLPLQKSLQLKPKTLIEMSAAIEAQLRKKRMEKKMGGWLQEIMSSHKIENKLLKQE